MDSCSTTEGEGEFEQSDGVSSVYLIPHHSAITMNYDRYSRLLHIDTYDAVKMSSFRLLFLFEGTVFTEHILWVEVLGVMALFGATWGMISAFDHEPCDEDCRDTVKIADWLATLAAFLLGFYTSLTVSRWWRLRTDGIGAMWSASSQLMCLLSECAPKDKQALAAIRRYARASMAIVFLKRRHKDDFKAKLDELVHRHILYQDEVDKLKAWGDNLSESIWTWVLHIVMGMHRRGDIKSEMMLTFLLDKVMLGRGAAALIGAQMGCPIPLPYVHLLGFMVKANNIVLALSCGFRAAKDPGIHLFLIGKVLFIPLMYNSVLLINAQLHDPFDGDKNDFPLSKYEKMIESDGESYIDAGENLPEWLSQWDEGHKSDLV